MTFWEAKQPVFRVFCDFLPEFVIAFLAFWRKIAVSANIRFFLAGRFILEFKEETRVGKIGGSCFQMSKSGFHRLEMDDNFLRRLPDEHSHDPRLFS